MPNGQSRAEVLRTFFERTALEHNGGDDPIRVKARFPGDIADPVLYGTRYGLIQDYAHIEVGLPGGIAAGAGAEGPDLRTREARTRPGGEYIKDLSIVWVHDPFSWASVRICFSAASRLCFVM